ncbi:reverse transcriptase [Trichonephila clavipes]|nr:reverse transcriptase [Trichonephila clavipes]
MAVSSSSFIPTPLADADNQEGHPKGVPLQLHQSKRVTLHCFRRPDKASNSQGLHCVCDRIIKCQTKIAFISNGWTAALQWVPSHVGIPVNDRTDQKANQEAESAQPEASLTLRRAKSNISTYIDKHTAMPPKTKNFGKSWETLVTVSPIPMHLEIDEAVDLLSCTTVHLRGCVPFGVYLHWLGVSANVACPLCGHARMDDDQLLQCTGLDEYRHHQSVLGGSASNG